MEHDSDEGVTLTPINLVDFPEVEDLPLVEGEDWIMAPDPTIPDNEEGWVIIILKGDFTNWVIRYDRFEATDDGRLSFDYDVVHRPELPEGFTINELDIANYMATILMQVFKNHTPDSDDTTTGDYIDL
jgi:hypothetical protein|tara:strand:- start:91 stop:477 length:387 start_codon:yes stop_codon:yes gene_type:complete